VAESGFDLRALCDQAGVTPRTVHFYVQQGLLPPAGTPGPGARYGQGHLARLRLIRLLQKQHLPLVEIARRLKSLRDTQVDGLLAEAAQRRNGRGSALDYIRGVLAETRAPAGPSAGPPGRPAASSSAADTPPAPAPARSQWDRFTLAEGIELQVQRPLPRLQQRRLDRLVAAARAIFDEEEP
jgi:DNA-binding transcriptional MerR regulator